MKIKKGVKGSHVGMILSFVIFITFIFFIFTALQPKLNFSADKSGSFDYIKGQVIKNVSSNFTIAEITIDVNKNPHGAKDNCIDLQSFLIWSEFVTPLIVVKNESDSNQETYTVHFAQGSGDLAINRKDVNNRFFKIYHSPKFKQLQDTGLSCQTISQGDYNIGLIKVGSEIFESEIDRLIADYNSSYSSLKTSLNIPSGTEFGFSFKTTEGIIKKPNYNVPASANVFANEAPILYVDSNTNIKSGFLTVAIW